MKSKIYFAFVNYPFKNNFVISQIATCLFYLLSTFDNPQKKSCFDLEHMNAPPARHYVFESDLAI